LKDKILSIFKIVFFLGIGIFLIWLVVRNLTEEQKQQIIAAFKEANYAWVVLAILVGIVSNVSRAIRWKMLLKPMGHSPKLSNTFMAIMIGYLANLAVPRLGEVSRCGILTKYEKIPFNQSFGTVITERIIDMICLIVLFIITFFVEHEKIYNYTIQTIVNPIRGKLSINTLLFSFILLVGFVLLVFIFRKKSKNSFLPKIRSIIKGFIEGVISIKNVEKPFWFVFHSVFIWFVYYLTVYICFYCFKETALLKASTAMVVLAFGSVAVIITPGGIGAYPVIVTEVLSLFNIPVPIGFALGWIVWLSQTLELIIIGLISLLLLPLINKEGAKPAPSV